MRTIALLACLAAAAVSGSALDRVTVDQLELRLAAAHDRSDQYLAHRLEDLQLTQRLSAARLEKLRAALPGPESRNALLSLADLSEVLELPSGELPPDPSPTSAEQAQMLARAYDASNSSADPLPDFDATANTTRFDNVKFLTSNYSLPVPVVTPVPLGLSHGTDAVTYREGRVMITPTSHAFFPRDTVNAGAESWDGLYTLLGNVMQDMRGCQPDWAHWEQGPTGKLAVFRFSVDQDHAHFPIRTVTDPSPKRGFIGHPGYNAEVALDPETGAVHRFVLRAKLDRGQHVMRADVAVEFGAAEVDGKSFLCPFRAVTIGVSQTFLGNFDVEFVNHEFQQNEDIRPLMHLVDVEFTAYRPGQSKPPATADSAFLAAAIRVTGERVTIEQLEKIVSDLGGSKDRDAAERLRQLDLTQRLTAERYARLRDRLPGQASSDALLALYDLSEFHDLPRADLADGPAPDPATQGKIVTSAVEFVAGVTYKMPDLFATRQLGRFEDLRVVRGAPQPLSAEVKPLVIVDQSTGTVHFREGREVVETASKASRTKLPPNGLDTWGTFGPLLEIVMADVVNSKIGWSHWEHGQSGRLAVFRYAVPEAASHYDVRLCCYLGQDGLPSSFAATPAYHGELAIDPETGAVLRLVLKADLRRDPPLRIEQERSPLLRSDVLVAYGAVDIASKTYICPERTVSEMTSWTLGLQESPGPAGSKHDAVKAAKDARASMEFSRVNAINEAVFRDYHVFRSEVRIVSDPGESGSAAPKQ